MRNVVGLFWCVLAKTHWKNLQGVRMDKIKIGRKGKSLINNLPAHFIAGKKNFVTGECLIKPKTINH